MLILGSWLFAQASSAQDCQFYERLMREGNQAFRETDYIRAVKKYQSAITNCPSKAAEVQVKVEQVFQVLQNLREKAEKNEQRALSLLADIAGREMKAAQQALDQINYEQVYVHLETALNSAREEVATPAFQILCELLIIELHAYPRAEWPELPSLGYFQRVGGRIRVSLAPGSSAFAYVFARIKEEPSKVKARNYILREVARQTGPKLYAELWKKYYVPAGE